MISLKNIAVSKHAKKLLIRYKQFIDQYPNFKMKWKEGNYLRPWVHVKTLQGQLI